MTAQETKVLLAFTLAEAKEGQSFSAPAVAMIDTPSRGKVLASDLSAGDVVTINMFTGTITKIQSRQHLCKTGAPLSELKTTSELSAEEITKLKETL